MSKTSQDLEPEEQGLIMKLSPLYVEWEEQALKKGEQQGRQQEKCLMIESMLEVKFGAVDEELSQIVELLSKLPEKEATQLIMLASREELVARFREQN